MANKIIPKRSSVAGKTPTSSDLEVGEIAVNLTDRKIFSKDTSNNVVQLGGGSGASVSVYSYDNRATLRSLSPTNNDLALVDGLGLFVFYTGSTEPDDDESCFATSSGRWLLEAVHWDVVDLWSLPENDARDDALDNFLTGYAVCTINSVGSVSSASFTGTVLGAAVGDRVIATPPAELGSGRLNFFAWVSARDTVTVTVTNASAATTTVGAALQTQWPITVIKS